MNNETLQVMQKNHLANNCSHHGRNHQNSRLLCSHQNILGIQNSLERDHGSDGKIHAF